MADEYREIAENNDNGNSKKKKIIIGVIAAVVIVVVIAVVCALKFTGNLGGTTEDYTDVPVSGNVFDSIEPGIENGVMIDGVPNEVTNNVTTSQDSDGSNSSSEEQSGSSDSSGNSGSSSNSGSSGNSGSSDDSDSSGNSGSSEDSGSSGDSGSSDNDTNENTPRQMNVSIILPNDGGAADKLYIYVNGELLVKDGQDYSEDVKINGGTFYFTTSKSYTGVVTVEVKLQNYSSHAKQISTETGSEISVSMPLDGSEENMAPAI